VGAKGLCLAGPPRSGGTSRPDSRDPVASVVMYELLGDKKKQDEVVDQSWCRVAAHNRSLHAGFVAVHHKTGWVTSLRNKTKTGGSVGGDGIWACREASKRRTRNGIARLASGLHEGRSPGIRPMVLQRHIPKVPLVGLYPSLGFRGILVFRLSPYTQRREDSSYLLKP
jgi:hypothetical protein